MAQNVLQRRWLPVRIADFETVPNQVESVEMGGITDVIMSLCRRRADPQ
jgi:hypothetical protein